MQIYCNKFQITNSNSFLNVCDEISQFYYEDSVLLGYDAMSWSNQIFVSKEHIALVFENQ
jgi:hypothetical protein